MAQTLPAPAATIRSWARENNITVGTRGALSKDVVEKYVAAHS